MEIWKDIDGYEGIYQVSNKGNVRSFKNGVKLLKPRPRRKGYLSVSLRKDGEAKDFRIHRLVALAFIPNPMNKTQVDHINAIKTDNRAENLRWATPKENANNPITKQKIVNYISSLTEEEKDRISKKKSKSHIGGRNSQAKRVYCDGVIFGSVTECSRFYEVSSSKMGRWLRRETTMPKEFVVMELKFVDEG